MARSERCRDAMTLGDAARLLGCHLWQVRRLFQRGLLPEPSRVGNYRVLRRADLARVRTALRRAGYLPAKGGRAHVRTRAHIKEP